MNNLKKSNGGYSKLNYIRRGFQLVNPAHFFGTKKKYVPGFGFVSSILMAVDYYYCLVRFGAIVDDYFEYEFWKKSDYVRRDYVTMKDAKRFRSILNKQLADVLRDKVRFNEFFKDFRTIQMYDYKTNSGYEAFHDFVVHSNRNIIAKPLDGESGVGIYKPDVCTDEKCKEVYEKHLNGEKKYFFEECFVQTGILGEINPSSVNTVRLVTIYDGKDVHVMTSLIRFGSGKSCCDNLHAGGMICEIDAVTGYIVSPGYNLKNEKTIYHPVTGHILLGVQIPNWGDVIRMAKEAALRIPKQRCVGWDIAVNDTGVCFIEGNDMGNFNAPQCACQRGIKKEFQTVVNKIK